MTTANELVSQGIAAYERGEQEEAVELLCRAVAQDPENEQAWLYLAQLRGDPAQTLLYLEKVLKINPDNEEARARRAALIGGPVVDEAPVTDDRVPNELPYYGIPGAPKTIDLDYLWQYTGALAQRSTALFTNPDPVRSGPIEAAKGTWWDVMLMAVMVGLATGLTVILRALFINARAINPFNLFSTPLIGALGAVVGLVAACLISHYFLNTWRGGKASLLDHTYTLAVIWVPASFVNLALILLEGLFLGSVITFRDFLNGILLDMRGGSLLLTIVAAVLVAYTLYLMRMHLERLYPSLEDRDLWIAGIVTLVVISLVM